MRPTFLALLLILMLPGASRAELVAERITAENFEQRHVGGTDADAGIDDWFLSNGTLCAAISDPAHESSLAPEGGLLIDLGHCGAANDQWTTLQPLLNLSQSHLVPVSHIEAGGDPGSAWVETRGIFQGVETTTRYSVTPDQPDSLHMHVELRRVAPGDPLYALGYVLFHPTAQTRPFAIRSEAPGTSRGFEYPKTDRRSIRSLIGALAATDTHVLVGGEELAPISYGLQQIRLSQRRDEDPADMEERPLASFSVTGLHFTALNILPDPLWFGSGDDAPGLLQLAQLPFMDVDDGETITLEYRVWIGKRADVASITDSIWPNFPLVQGRVDDSRARIRAELPTGGLITEVRSDAEGIWSARLPPGPVTLSAVAPGERQTQSAFVVEADQPRQRAPALSLGEPARVELDGGFIGRLRFFPEDPDATGSNTPIEFGNDLLGLRIGDKAIPAGLTTRWVNRRGLGHPETVILPPGRYRVTGARGPEYDLMEIQLEVRAGETASLDLAPLDRVAPSAHWLSADLHVHSAESFDSSLPTERQVEAFAASGTEILIATEHDFIFDPAAAIESAGLAKILAGVSGVEITGTFEGGDVPYGSGHLNAFPIAPIPMAYRAGAPSLEGRRVRDALADVRSASPGVFVQMNHPRPTAEEAETEGYFSHLGVAGEPFEPARSIAEEPNRVLLEEGAEHGLRDVDFHGIELLNGPNLDRYRRVRADWLSLLLQGERRVATANSDSHRAGTLVGLPRTYVRMGDRQTGATRSDSPAGFDQTTFMQALHAGHAYGSTGPLLEVRLGEAGLGDLYSGGTGTLHVSIRAAEWVPVSEWRAYVNGELVHQGPASREMTKALPLVFPGDSIVTVEVEGPASGRYAEAYPDFIPFAFTNPIFVDADQDGRFTAPGLGSPIPSTLRTPLDAD